MHRFAALLALALLLAPRAAAADLEAATAATIDRAVKDALAESGAPSASIAVVRNGELAYARAYGLADVEARRKAAPGMRYCIGSISKQLTAAAVLLLVEDGRLSLDDKVVRWFPELTRARDVTLRELLSMTSGYQDFWPQDYVMPMMRHDVTPRSVIDRWGRLPLDFEPGTRWQYSNTNYVILGAVVESVSGMPLVDFLRKRVFTPLHMETPVDYARGPLPPGGPARYLRYALGPPRRAPAEGHGWMSGAAELAMTAGDLARWDVALMKHTILSPAATRALETEVRLASGVGSGYGLGVALAIADGRRLVRHNGEVSGFTAANYVYPDDGTAVVVLTNLDATRAADTIAKKIADIVFAPRTGGRDPALEAARAMFIALQHGRLDRSRLSANANAYFTEQAIHDFASSLGPLGPPREMKREHEALRGGMILRRYLIKLARKRVRLVTFTLPDGKIEEYQVMAAD